MFAFLPPAFSNDRSIPLRCHRRRHVHQVRSYSVTKHRRREFSFLSQLANGTLAETNLERIGAISAYVEADYLNRATSNPFRLRQYFGKFQSHNWEILAGRIGDRQIRVVRRLGDWHAAISLERGRDVLPKIVHDTKRTHLEAIGLLGAKGRHGASLAAVVHASPKLDLVSQQFWSKSGGVDALSTIPAGVSHHLPNNFVPLFAAPPP
ncbi:MAG: hypothetical protein M3Z36_08950 [Acidobacteriota bacterium]|nr:hypothetical protein [Acidobacteriota bacterium]